MANANPFLGNSTSSKNSFVRSSTAQQKYISDTLNAQTVAPTSTPPTGTNLNQDTWNKLNPQAQQRLTQTSQKVVQSKADIMNPVKIAGDVGNAAINTGKDIITGAINEAKDIPKQISIGASVLPGGQGSGLLSPSAIKNQTDYINSAVKKGTITQQEATNQIGRAHV